MASAIDTTVPADDEQVDKSDIRSNFSTAATEITELQRQNSLAYRIAFGITTT